MAAEIAIIVILAACYGFMNGLHGSASIVSTLISSRAMNPRGALLLASLGVMAGPFIFGAAVASTIGAELIDPMAATVPVVIAALTVTILWNWATLRLGLPTSASQALIGSLIGAAWAGYGQAAILPGGLIKSIIGLFLSPLLGLIAGYFVTRGLWWWGGFTSPNINRWFKRGQILLSVLMAATFGSNDGQKVMGVIIIGLVATGFATSFTLPIWVIAVSAGAMGIGTFIGGWPLIHTLANKFYKIRPIEGFGALATAVSVLASMSAVGGPVSSSQVVTSAIVGAGSADRIQKIRWNEVQRILLGWGFTIPATAALSAGLYFVLGVFS